MAVFTYLKLHMNIYQDITHKQLTGRLKSKESFLQGYKDTRISNVKTKKNKRHSVAKQGHGGKAPRPSGEGRLPGACREGRLR